MTPYFYLTFLTLLVVIIYAFRPFDPVIPRARKETFLDPRNTDINDPIILQAVKVPSGVRASRPTKLQAYASTGTTMLSASFVKSAFNAAWDGAKSSAQMLTYVISRGCRFLDAELFLSRETSHTGTRFLMVGFGGNLRQNKSFVLDENVLPLSDFLRCVMGNAFSSSVTQVATDPVFLHFRMQVEQQHAARAASSLAGLLDEFVRPSRIIKSNELELFSVAQMRNKVVVLLDHLTCPWLSDVQTSRTPAVATLISDYCSGLSGTTAIPLYKKGNKTSPSPSPGGAIGIALPSASTSSLLSILVGGRADGESFSLTDMRPGAGGVSNAVFLAMPYYIRNRALDTMEMFFDSQESAIASRDSVQAYVQSKDK